MVDEGEETPCEKALLLVLPLFAANVEDDPTMASRIVSVSEIDDYGRELQSFRANFLSEVRRLEKLVREVVSPWNTSLDLQSDEYVEILIKILTLLDRYVSAKILDAEETPGTAVLGSSLVSKLSYGFLDSKFMT
jgi:hypothetical protein